MCWTILQLLMFFHGVYRSAKHVVQLRRFLRAGLSKRTCLPAAGVWSATGEVNHIRRIVLACERET